MNHLKFIALLGLLFMHTQRVTLAAVGHEEEEEPIELHHPHLTKEQLEAGLKPTRSEIEADRMIGRVDYAIKRLAQIGHTTSDFGSISNTLWESLPLDKDESVPVIDIADAIIQSFDKYNGAQKGSLEDQRMKIAIQRSNLAFAAGLEIVIAKTLRKKSKEARAINVLLLLGGLNAEGSNDLSVVDASARLMESLTKKLQKMRPMDTAETLLAPSIAEAWPEWTPDQRRARAAQLIGLR